MLIDKATTQSGPLGVGDFCYTVGLFKILTGKQRNLPIVHFGTVALMSTNERIPVADWENRGATRHVEGHLVEAQSLSGLSGSPVFVRRYMDVDDVPLNETSKVGLRVPTQDLLLFGIWQGAWDARPDAIFALGAGLETRVPLGMGVIVPSYQLLMLLNTDKLEQRRQLLLTRKIKPTNETLDLK